MLPLQSLQDIRKRISERELCLQAANSELECRCKEYRSEADALKNEKDAANKETKALQKSLDCLSVQAADSRSRLVDAENESRLLLEQLEGSQRIGEENALLSRRVSRLAWPRLLSQ